jgi:hypothetical protein
MIFAAIFSIIVGVGMIGQWGMSYVNKQIPELKTEPIRIGFHITGEMVTAVCLVISGVGLLTSVGWAVSLFLVSSGMLFYTVIVSPGYFAQKGEWLWMVMFGAILAVGIVSIVLVL